ncbi:uncharacterized protein TRUGW13939_06578 [Talaromyces rugulosus]|uniref:Zn(2)-C6 fungal-type domain-containing protein n=1 Tax=Talaromyces rugulosus TaxID=121627 RepID=A0A7H8QZ75_TALRU|nr:uncharacterized protein TRUGW13939_06578 [Talaromyces rugulosus]QKX59444.1 hypothetical protein TRUGW13939_06578 [Talaromyces rugulosus]
MAGKKSNPPKGTLACDTCYKRKVKCDRQDPCKNCIATKTTCQWTRQVRERRRKPNTADAVRTLEDRVHHLENLLQHSDKSEMVTQTDVLDADHDGDMEKHSPGNSRVLDILDQGPPAPTPNPTFNLPPGPLRLADALEKVREAVTIFSSSRSPRRNIESESLTSTDILNAMTRPSNDPADVIQPAAVNKMGLALLSDDFDPLVQEEKLTYQTIMSFKAALVLGQQTPQSTTNVVARHIKRIQTRKFEASLVSAGPGHLKRCSSWCLLYSFVSLLQAYYVQVIVSQFFGDLWKTRYIMAEWSEALVDLRYPLPKTPDTEAVANCLKWCYRADMFMSVFLRQSRHMSRRLDEAGEGDLGIYEGLLYHLQDRLLHLETLTIDVTQRAVEIEKLDHYVKVHPDMQKDDTRLDFRLYATLTVLWHGHPDLDSKKHIQTQLTGYARETLKLLNQVDPRPGPISCEADITLHWNMLCSGVLPMLILCIHTLRFNDTGDFKLLKDYTRIVSGLNSDYNKDNNLATQVEDLCVALVQICEASSCRRERERMVAEKIPTNHDARRKNFLNFDSFFVTENHKGDDDDDDDDENLDAMVAESLTLQPKIYEPRVL